MTDYCDSNSISLWRASAPKPATVVRRRNRKSAEIRRLLDSGNSRPPFCASARNTNSPFSLGHSHSQGELVERISEATTTFLWDFSEYTDHQFNPDWRNSVRRLRTAQ
jgi:hypothetical protein